MNKANNVEIHWGIQVPLRDGIHLHATVYAPKKQGAPQSPGAAPPCILALTPYGSDVSHAYAKGFAAQGLPFVIVDVRGRGNSGGVFRAAIQEADDGYDVVEWLAQQPYCSGQVAMWGGSYLGYCQWATAKEFPPHLATIVPTAAPCFGVEFPMRNNIFFPYIVQWLALTAGRLPQVQLFSDSTWWSTIYRRWHDSGRTFRELDTLLGNPSPLFQEWLTHPEPDAYWDAYNPTAQQYAQLRLPILTITGSYDDDQPGALEHYKQHMRHASAEARAQHYLIIGPWDHARTIAPHAEFGGLKCGPASVVDLSKLHLEWYAWTMQSGPKPVFLKKTVAYYVMGAERWRYADTLEEVTTRHHGYFLDSVAAANDTGTANDVFSSGSLGDAPGAGQPDQYRYDPRDTAGPEVEAEALADGSSLVDQTVTLAMCEKQLVYHSAPFDRDLEISGFFKLCVWIAIDCPDTDLYVSVYEIGLDGGSVRLSTDAIRARYREGLRAPKLICTTEPLRYDFDRFTFVSRQIKRGHRLRLVIAPIGRFMQTTFAEKNFNGGGVVAEECAADARFVTVRLFHDQAHPSALYAPLGHP